MARHNLLVFRFGPVVCGQCGHVLDRAVARERLRDGKDFTFCSECGNRLTLPKADAPIQLTQHERSRVEDQRTFAAQRSRFEQAVFQLVSRKLPSRECFIGYPWQLRCGRGTDLIANRITGTEDEEESVMAPAAGALPGPRF